MSKWRYEVTKKNCDLFDKPKYIQFSKASVIGNDGKVSTWDDLISEIPTLRVQGRYHFDVKGGTYGNKTYDAELGMNWFFPAKRLGRMFPRHKQQITYKEGGLE